MSIEFMMYDEMEKRLDEKENNEPLYSDIEWYWHTTISSGIGKLKMSKEQEINSLITIVTPDPNVKVSPRVVQKLAEGVEGGVSKKSKKLEQV